MEYLLVALALLIAVGGIAAAVAFPTIAHERDSARSERDTAQADASAARAALAEGVAKYEATISALKVEVTKLDGELDALATPGAVRARLRSLFPPTDAASNPLVAGM